MKRILTKNIGKRGRILRFCVAMLLLGGAYYYSSFTLLIVALFVFFEAFMSWCVVLQMFGKGSCKIKK